MARKRTNPHAQMKRRLPFVAVIEREEPFRAVDRREIEAECCRITNGENYKDFYLTMARFGGVYWHTVHFVSEHQADAFRGWCGRNGIARRDVPRFGPSSEEKAAFRQACLVWGFRTGAIRRIVQAFRKTKGSLTLQWSAAHSAAASYRPPEGDVATELVCWAMENHWHWFHRQRRPTYWEDPNEYPPQEAYPHSE